MPIYDMDTDLLISNTFIFRTVSNHLPYKNKWEIFEHDDFTRYFPAVACLNNYMIDNTMNNMTLVLGMMNLQAEIIMGKTESRIPNLVNLSENIKLNEKTFKKQIRDSILSSQRFEYSYQAEFGEKKESPSSMYQCLESLKLNLSEQALIFYMMYLHQQKKLNRLD
jgi:hypothetical protein